MINLLLGDVSYTQDVRELFMAFYPGEEYTYEAEKKALVSVKASTKGERYFFVIEFHEEGREDKISFDFPIHSKRIENKNEIKRNIYHILSKRLNKDLPWGTLTGIRPTKLIMEKLAKREQDEEIIKYMKDAYLISDNKLSLCLKTAKREKEILDKLDYDKGFSLYVGIPFCPSTCAYCSFTSYPIERLRNLASEYVEYLCKEIKAVALAMKDRKLQTVYMGGGTPTSLEAYQLKTILSCIKESFDTGGLLEFCVEAGRPDSISKEKLEVLKEAGVGRISVNPQTMNNKTLKLIGRNHSVEEFIEKFRLARSLGFDNINADLIMSLPQESIDDVSHTMQEIKKLAPESVTIHSLAIKRAARLNTNKEEYYGMKIETAAKMIDFASACVADMGLEPYYMYRQKNMAGNFENVGYAKRGYESIYNILIMEEKQNIIACGAGTSTKLVFSGENRIERLENIKDPKLYIERFPEVLAKKLAGIDTLK